MKYVRIVGLKASGNYSDQFRSNKMSVSFCEGPKLPNSMISGFVSPWEPLFIDLNIPKYFAKYKAIEETCRTSIFVKRIVSTFEICRKAVHQRL